MSFYKTNAPAVLVAWEQESAQRVALQAAINAFSARFGGKGLMYADPARFAGIKFPTPAPRDLWRAPDRNGLQWPRSAPLKGATADTKAALKALNADWDQHVPRGSVDGNDVYEALGFSSSMDFLFEGLTLFVHEGFLYASTSKAMPALTEILGSEYEAARQAMRQGGAA
ncbi:hypothetical protein ATCM_12620 [Stenotrophomonas sp. ATCM1_4]|uniref:hypothetical protein n=1 Tax=Stenotrophomonas sp. ATCM1_4 TaxID=2259330 RepID=UPI001049B218|nr:hypothetical protein [Stenotrophomonas sp. ATCM1_4]TDB28428.1 hypothetical protein ATCM_12620 [Stenotrophomonas sp. ATCM1_4]